MAAGPLPPNDGVSVLLSLLIHDMTQDNVLIYPFRKVRRNPVGQLNRAARRDPQLYPVAYHFPPTFSINRIMHSNHHLYIP